MTDQQLLRHLGHALLNTLCITLVILAVIAAHEPAQPSAPSQPVVDVQWRR